MCESIDMCMSPCHSVQVVARQQVEVTFFFSHPMWDLGLNLGSQFSRQVPSPTEPSRQPDSIFLVPLYCISL